MTNKKATRSDKVSLILFGLAIVLLLATTIGAAIAALIENTDYETYIHTDSMSFELLYDGDDVVQTFLGKDADGKTNNWAPGRLYNGSVKIKNDGELDEYVRVVVHKYWMDGDGKRTDLDPSLIGVNFASGWNQVGSTAESVTYVRSSAVAAGSTADMLKSIKLDGKIVNEVERVTEGNTITTTYKYDGMQIGIDLEVAAVQTGSKSDAMLSAWGKSN